MNVSEHINSFHRIKEHGSVSRYSYTLIDRDHNISWVNNVLEQKGFHASNVVGNSYYHIFHGESAPHEYCTTKTALLQNRITYKVTQGADKKWYQTVSVPINSGSEVSHALEIGHQLHGKHAEKETLHQLSEAINHMQHSTFVMDRHMRIAAINSAYEQLKGFAAWQAIGNMPFALQEQNNPRSLLKTKQYPHDLKVHSYQSKKRDGTQYQSQLHLVPIHNTLGHAHFFIGTDIVEEE